MGKKIGIGFVVLLVVLLGVISMQPSTYHVERSAEMAAPPAVVFALVADLKELDKWSPWTELDPTMKTTYGEKTVGVGGSYEWNGNDDVGHGKMTILESTAPTKLRMRLDFISPMTGTAESSFTLAAAGKGTKVTWDVKGDNDFMSKAFGLVMDIEGMIGDTYEKGLKKLGEVAKTEAAAQAKAKAEAEAQAKAKAEAAALAVAGDAGSAEGAK